MTFKAVFKGKNIQENNPAIEDLKDWYKKRVICFCKLFV